LAETVIRLVGTKSRIIHLALPEDDPRQRNPDIALATKTLDWRPKVSLEDGLKETIAYFRNALNL
jgi:UDP-glucuronate decarboxylase